MKGNFDACLAVTLPHEGGWSDHKKDPGGATMKGITLTTFRGYKPMATKADLKAISDDDVRRIYAKGYWYPIAGDDLPAGMDLAVFDYGVNSGPARAAKTLQTVVGTAQDGKIGGATLLACKAAEPIGAVKSICSRRLSFLRGLSTFSTFGKGWARRVADVEAAGVKMVLAARGASSATIKQAMGAEAQAADRVARQRNQAAVSTGGAGASAGAGSTMLDLGDVNWWIIGGVALVAVAAIVFLRSRASIHQARADAYRDAISG